MANDAADASAARDGVVPTHAEKCRAILTWLAGEEYVSSLANRTVPSESGTREYAIQHHARLALAPIAEQHAADLLFFMSRVDDGLVYLREKVDELTQEARDTIYRATQEAAHARRMLGEAAPGEASRPARREEALALVREAASDLQLAEAELERMHDALHAALEVLEPLRPSENAQAAPAEALLAEVAS